MGRTRLLSQSGKPACAAREVVTNRDGILPRETAALRALPGVGRLYRGAVASFAWELAEPAVDTNVARVLRRAFHPRLTKGAAGDRQLQATAKTLVPRDGQRRGPPTRRSWNSAP